MKRNWLSFVTFALGFAIAVPLVVLHADTPRMGIFSEAVSDPASQADGAMIANNITAEGAILGDFCIASLSVDVLDVTVTCAITAAAVATVVIQNESGSALDLAAHTQRVAVFKSGQF